MVTPTTERSTVKIVIERAFKAFQHVDRLREARRLQGQAGIYRTLPAATNEQHRAIRIALEQAFDLAGKFRIDFPIRRFLPGHMLGTDRMADIHMFDFRPAIDQHRLGMSQQESMGGAGIEMLHGLVRSLCNERIILARNFRPGAVMKFTTWISAIFSALAALTLPACDFVNLPEIKPGITSAAEVRSRMGEPGFIHNNEDGSETWEYSRQPAGVHCHMISFGRDRIVSRMEQVLTEANYARIKAGQTQAEIRRLLGAPASKAVFKNLREEVWEWRIESLLPGEEKFLNVHFDLESGLVTKGGTRVAPGGR